MRCRSYANATRTEFCATACPLLRGPNPRASSLNMAPSAAGSVAQSLQTAAAFTCGIMEPEYCHRWRALPPPGCAKRFFDAHLHQFTIVFRCVALGNPLDFVAVQPARCLPLIRLCPRRRCVPGTRQTCPWAALKLASAQAAWISPGRCHVFRNSGERFKSPVPSLTKPRPLAQALLCHLWPARR